MDNTYLKLGVEELIQDRDFVAWVIYQKKSKEWQELAAQNPEFAKTARTARKIIHLLEDKHEVLSEEDVYNLWEDIGRFDDQHKRQAKIIRLRNIFRYVAMIVLFIVVPGLLAMYFVGTRTSYPFAGTIQSEKPSDSQLILASGERISLKKDNSIVALKDQRIQINNDSIINLKVEEENNSKQNEIVVPYGKRSQLVLGDGTKVWLNAGSHFAFPSRFDPKSRTVYLEGEAFFEVTHNAHQPFFVNTGCVKVKVLGTRFNVSAYSSDSSIQTVLVEGKVAIQEVGSLAFLKKDVLLEPNQKATYSKTEKTMTVENEKNTSMSVDWVSGWFSFSQQSLTDVLNKLERYYNVKFDYDARFPSNELISGKMELKESLGEVLSFLADLAKVEFKISGNVIHVKRQINK